jgi:protein tyrosine phosphatase (PTP) superfamily phosphohydrolase (DUF442 family)
MSLEEIYNFIQISDTLATSGQPTEAQMGEIAAAGYKVIVNLALPNSDNALKDEAGTVRALGMDYRNIPVAWEAPKLSDFEQFVPLMDSLAGQKVFVHCAANYRVSMFVALYGEKRWGWTRAQADAHIRRIWEPDEVWARFIESVRGVSYNQK